MTHLRRLGRGSLLFASALAVGVSCHSSAKPLAITAASTPSGAPTSVGWTGDDEGWVASFADYPPGVETDWHFDSGRRPAPSPVVSTHRSLFIGGDNHSDDLFMFWKRRIDGLAPGRYAASLEATFATNAPKLCSGVGGAPGESVFMKLGLSASEPLTKIGEDGSVRMTIDKGNQAKGGQDAATVGDVATSNTDCKHRRWEMKTVRTASPIAATADRAGSLWVLAGTDSGYEARSEIYYTSIRVSLNPIR